MGSLCDITSALRAPFRRSRAVLFFHFRTPRAGPPHFNRAAAAAAASARRSSAARSVVAVSSPQLKSHPARKEREIKSGFAVVSPPDFTALFPARGFIIALLTLFTNSPKWRTRTSTSRSCWRKETCSTRPSYTP